MLLALLASELRFELEQTQASLQQAEEELSSQRDEVDLTRERIHELEIGGSPKSRVDDAERLRSSSVEADGASGMQVEGDLDDALSGRTKTECVARLVSVCCALK
jgi:outer membrane protein TolC